MSSSNHVFTDVIPARYGYWISRSGAILRVDDTEGHVPFLFDVDDFRTLSPFQPFYDWYEAALSRGWIRVIAATQDRTQFRFQFKAPPLVARRSLIALLNGLPPYERYVFESSSYQVFSSAKDAAVFVQECATPVSNLGMETWTT